jgi:hypothetical protein
MTIVTLHLSSDLPELMVDLKDLSIKRFRKILKIDMRKLMEAGPMS